MIAGIELGGTKTVVAVGSVDGEVHEERRYPTTTPGETLAQAVTWLRERGTPGAIGIAAFGPLCVDPRDPNYGCLLDTPKPNWAGASIIEPFQEAFPEAPVTIDTDVNAAVFAEAKLGAAKDLENVAYITIGTGIGAGILCNGRLIHGAAHPEFGHLKIPRAPGDDFAGVCPFHSNCLEGMASGPAIAARWDSPAVDLPPTHAAWKMEAWYLAHGVLALSATVSPARVIIGGGVSQADGFHALTESIYREVAAGYFKAAEDDTFIVRPALGQQSGIAGALLLPAVL